MAKSNIIYAVGRRKTATARIRLYKSASVPGFDGVQLVVNGVDAKIYFPGEEAVAAYRQPFFVTESLKTYSASAKVVGSGKAGQLGAVIHGIARALAKADPEQFHTPLKKANLLTRDSRAKERRKVGTGGKARRRKQSPKR